MSAVAHISSWRHFVRRKAVLPSLSRPPGGDETTLRRDCTARVTSPRSERVRSPFFEPRVISAPPVADGHADWLGDLPSTTSASPPGCPRVRASRRRDGTECARASGERKRALRAGARPHAGVASGLPVGGGLPRVGHQVIRPHCAIVVAWPPDRPPARRALARRGGARSSRPWGIPPLISRQAVHYPPDDQALLAPGSDDAPKSVHLRCWFRGERDAPAIARAPIGFRVGHGGP
jgi:hypothetical protein